MTPNQFRNIVIATILLGVAGVISLIVWLAGHVQIVS
jgi:hypothetical protein